VIHAGIIERTWHSLIANAARGFSARDNLYLLAADEGIPKETVLAVAVVASNSVDANRVAAARVSITLVDVETLNIGIASETRWAETLDSVGTCVTMRILPTQSLGTVRLLLDTAAVIRISTGTRIADTLRFLKTVLAMRVLPASRIAARWLNRWHTK
jgi:hypothetical protein